ncbi:MULTISPECIES: hypothetical protein [Streptomyces]|jgi:hypothetical protein|uniref:Uncharacterized protein n=1 Tax=Streptomyces stelliscabiei TaxID=146820 RepID=A0A8I0TTZ5_9ACTN|nr:MULTISPECIES: hypothetical protein [Streptomyces]MBP5933079.1 hypothetical protein [Streptomyces sp. LBUM 1479]KFG09455.1 hypothetical protein IQ61_08420 [Streptomyces scabiei]KND44717.1 hypothetical protein IQ64_11160 [Streptomyces stelliscabiei]MBE1601655.1 hypothetical protein [Streptomyces stelliscabiei]MDH6454368.1 hypothetical protein [Streptomyces sp. SAI-119]
MTIERKPPSGPRRTAQEAWEAIALPTPAHPHVAVEVSRESALELAAAVQRVLAAVPEGVE